MCFANGKVLVARYAIYKDGNAIRSSKMFRAFFSAWGRVAVDVAKLAAFDHFPTFGPVELFQFGPFVQS